MSEQACGRCGRDPAAGFAKVGDVRYCHGDYDAKPTCYMQSQRDPLGVQGRRTVILRMRSEGATFPEIGAAIGVTGQRAGTLYREALRMRRKERVRLAQPDSPERFYWRERFKERV